MGKAVENFEGTSEGTNIGDELVYVVNAEDILISVDGEWDGFALDNGGPEATTGRVLGRSIWNFIADGSTRQIYRHVLTKVRLTRVSMRFPFRCDGPDCRRFLEMHIVPGSDHSVRFHSRTLRVERRPRQPLLDSARTRGDTLLRMCSWCKKINVDGEWLEAEAAIEKGKLFDTPALPAITHGICDTCRQEMLERI